MSTRLTIKNENHPQSENRDAREKSAEKVYFRSQILERPSIDEYWNISGLPVLH